MRSLLIEDWKSGKKGSSTVIVPAHSIGAVGNPFAVRLLAMLAKNPASPSDIARMMNEDQQKVYYHIRKLQSAGVIEVIGSERRHGLMANIYTTVSPVVATRLYEDEGVLYTGLVPHTNTMPFFSPFVRNGKLSTSFILGAPIPHGKYEKASYDGAYATDLAAFFGTLLGSFTPPLYRFDTGLIHEDLKQNIIVIGSPVVNTVTEQLNQHLPLQFLEERAMAILSKSTGKVHEDHGAGVVIRMRNPFNPEAFLLLLAGRHSTGTIAAIKAVTEHLEKLAYNPREETLARVVIGQDRNSDGRVDHVTVVE